MGSMPCPVTPCGTMIPPRGSTILALLPRPGIGEQQPKAEYGCTRCKARRNKRDDHPIVPERHAGPHPNSDRENKKHRHGLAQLNAGHGQRIERAKVSPERNGLAGVFVADVAANARAPDRACCPRPSPATSRLPPAIAARPSALH